MAHRMWVPSEELDALNDHIVSLIEALREFRR